MTNMISESKISKELLKKLLYGWSSKEQLSEILREHPELEEYHRIVIPMHHALTMVMNLIGQQIIDDDITSVEEVADPRQSKWLLSFLIPDEERLSKHPKIPDESMRNIISKTEDPEEALDVFLTIHAGLEYPDYLTEESYWLARSVEPGVYAKFLGRCVYALEFCLHNGINRQFILDSLESPQK